MEDLKNNNELVDIIDDPYFGIQTCNKRVKYLSDDKLEKIING